MQPKVYGALLLFLARPGHLLSRRDLLDALWQDVVVNEEAITQTLRKLRRALGDDSKAPRFIETVPKRGYRFIATIETIATPTAAGPHT
ncbi:MAG: winged helix-turn-helix domain-containing protein, partial [Deltaproteobacteria bacterium]|nr:winged helix-turn-helix domain-containing protein [Deltaproteobacteria bacterium]